MEPRSQSERTSCCLHNSALRVTCSKQMWPSREQSWAAHLEEPVHLEVAHVVGRAHGRAVVGRHLVVARGVVPVVENARQPADAQAAKVDDARGAHVVDVGRGPAAVVELPEVVCRLVVAPDCTTSASSFHPVQPAQQDTGTRSDGDGGHRCTGGEVCKKA